MYYTGCYIIRLWQTSGRRSFNNTLPTRLYWVLLPIEDVGLAVETAKRILTKEKIDRQLAGQSSLIPFMKIRDVYISKKVITAQGNNQNKQFKPKIYQGKRKGQTIHYYDQGNYQNMYRSNSGDRRMSFICRGQYEQNFRGRLQYVNAYRNDFRRDNFRGMQNYRSQNLEVYIQVIIEMMILEEVEVGLGKDNS